MIDQPDTGPNPAPVTVTVARRVAPGREQEFQDWATRLTAAAARFPGFLGAGLLRPGHVGQDWHVVYRFGTADHLANWEQSPTRAALLASGEDLMTTTDVHRISGLETWFSLPGRTAPAPPRWKMFLVSGAAIALLNLLLRAVFNATLRVLPLVVAVCAVSVIVTALMTWLVMPWLARLLAGWLYAPPRQP